MQTITIEVKGVYGVLKAYPVCDSAKVFAEIAGSKTITHATLCRIERLGYKIECHNVNDYSQVA